MGRESAQAYAGALAQGRVAVEKIRSWRYTPPRSAAHCDGAMSCPRAWATLLVSQSAGERSIGLFLGLRNLASVTKRSDYPESTTRKRSPHNELTLIPLHGLLIIVSCFLFPSPCQGRDQQHDPDRSFEQEVPMAARLRHIAISVPDPERAAKFFEEAFGMTIAGRAGVGLYVSDGTINVALLRFPGEVPGFTAGYYGLIHFGMWVDDLDEAAKKVVAAGGSYYMGRADNNPNTYYEVKYKDPNGVVFDLTHTGWVGAVKEVVPAGSAIAAA